MRRYLPLLLLLLVAAGVVGCADRERTPILGTWTGGFFDDQNQLFKGYLTLYRTGDKFKMRLTSKEQAMDFEGTWTVAKHRVTLTTTDIKFDNPTEEDQKALGIKIIQPDEVRAAYAKPVALDLDSNKQKMAGLTMTLGSLTGKHRFEKGEATARAQEALNQMK